MPLTIQFKEQVKFQPHVQRLLELCIPVILCESNYFITLIFKIRVFILFLGPHVVPRYKGLMKL